MLTKIKIMTVTRDPALMTFLQRELSDEEYEVINTQHSGLHLKEVVTAERPELIILDIVMPSLDGIGTCLQMRQWTQAPIMMLSTWGASNGQVKGLNLGSESYLSEPFGAATVKQRIDDMLKRTVTINSRASGY